MNFKILVVDDNVDFRENISILLEEEGYQVVLASNGTQALEILKESLVDIVLTDLQMGSGDDGIVLLEQARCIDICIPIILMSLSVTRGNDRKYLKMGFYAAIDKLGKDFYKQIIESVKNIESIIKK